jgi:hypothetical protein
MYDDILGDYGEEKDKKPRPKSRINLKDQICYDCQQPYDLCECEEGFNIEDLDLDEEESKLGAIDDNEEDPWDGCDKDDCEDDCDCAIPPEQDIGC